MGGALALVAGEAQERVTEGGRNRDGNPLGQGLLSGHIPAATSLSPSVSPPPTSSSHFHMSHSPDTSGGKKVPPPLREPPGES